MIRLLRYSLVLVLISLASCQEVLEPKPVDLLVDDLVLNEPNDVQPVRIGLYSAFRGMASANIIAGDFTADYIQANGTFNDYIQLGTKQITASNGAVDALWAGIYNTIYVANFIIERLPLVSGVPEATKKSVLAEARFLRGWANFIGAYTFGDIPKVTSTDQGPTPQLPELPKRIFWLQCWPITRRL
ncbi:RagB/SusD family nutrient uptake outer membrane protein [Spirosoma telluris]|uniref:RagB/SusD family nutrient uptake outer membrane protein n=1 Tax=Spirosoma telluris TaxID=2183553 RepID=UPI002FC38158